jgi:hypothetical protein
MAEMWGRGQIPKFSKVSISHRPTTSLDAQKCEDSKSVIRIKIRPHHEKISREIQPKSARQNAKYKLGAENVGTHNQFRAVDSGGYKSGGRAFRTMRVRRTIVKVVEG